MILNTLYIRRASYGVNEGKMEGTLEFSSPGGKVELVLDDDFCQKVLALAADGMVARTRELAENLTASIISSKQAAIEAPAPAPAPEDDIPF